MNKDTKSNIIENDKYNKLTTCLNTGNYVINKYLIENLNISNEINNISLSNTCDVIYYNTLLFEQFNMDFHIVKDLEYIHNIHNGSVYITENHMYRKFSNYVHQRFASL